MDTALKQRLIGAAVLVALAVFFLPMLVKGPAPDSGVSDVSIDIPEGPDGAMETRDLPLVAPGEVPKGGAVGMDATPLDRPGPTLSTAPTDADPAADDGASTSPDGTAAPTTPETSNPAAVSLPPAAAGGDYAVHFGAYASAKAAETVVALAKAAQLPAYSEQAMVGDKEAWRVRIGPYSTRADAEAARLKALSVRNDVPVRVVVLNAEAAPSVPTAAAALPMPSPTSEAPKPAEPAKPEPKPVSKPEPKPLAVKPTDAKAEVKPVVASKPTTPAPMPAAPKPAAPPKPVETAAVLPKPTIPKPAEPKPTVKPAASGTLVAVAPKPKPVAAANVGFAVQLGAFSESSDAIALRDRLRASGFSAFTETVTTDKGKLTRVRVGPVVDRAAADQLKAQVRSKTGVDGIVRPHP